MANKINGKKNDNILSFDVDANFFCSYAEEAIKKSDFATAIRYLLRAQGLDKNNEDILMRLAECYTLIEQFEYSNNIYFKILSRDEEAVDCLYGLGQNYYYLNNLEASLFYLKAYASDAEPLDFDEYSSLDLVEAAADDELISKFRLVHPEPKPTTRDAIAIAKNLMKQNKFEDAAEMFLAALSVDPNLIFAKNNLCLCYFFLNRLDEAAAAATEVLRQDADNVFALCNLATIYNTLGQNAKCREVLGRIITNKPDDITDLYKIATTCCEIEKHSYARDYLLLIHHKKPYDINILFLLAISLYNLKQYGESLKYFVSILKIFEKNHTAKFYVKYLKNIIDGVAEAKPLVLPYSPQLPQTEIENRIDSLNTFASLPIGDLKAAWNASGLYELCDWALSLCDCRLSRSVLKLVAKINDGKSADFMRAQLINVFQSNLIKKEIIRLLIFNGQKKEIVFLLEDALKTVKIKYPDDFKALPSALREAYAFAASTLAFVTEFFEDKLLKTFKSVLKNISDNGVTISSPNTLAAVFCYKMSDDDLPDKKEFLCQIFDTDIKTFNKYLIKLNSLKN
jgi:tetratricopeptide (TPR) repeat protein